jgi:chromosome segregation ATPase
MGPRYIAPAAGARKPRCSTDRMPKMSMTHTDRNLILLTVLWLAVATTCQAAERVYKWADANGQIHYSNRMPPEAARHEREELNQSGRVIKVYNAPLTPEEKAEARQIAELEEMRKEREKMRAVHDRSLLATYSSKQDMLSARQSRINMVEAMIQLTSSRITTMQESMQKLTEEAANYERSGKPLPLGLKQELRSMRGQIEHNKRFAADKEAEIEQIKKQFEQDIARYEELTSHKAQGGSPQRTPLEIAMSNPKLQLSREDRTLLTMYSSEADLLYARSEDRDKLDADIKQIQDQVDTLQKNLAEMAEDASSFEADGKPVPDELAGRMKDATQAVTRGEAELEAKRKEKQDTETRYATAIDRFRYLVAGAK